MGYSTSYRSQLGQCGVEERTSNVCVRLWVYVCVCTSGCVDVRVACICVCVLLRVVMVGLF